MIMHEFGCENSKTILLLHGAGCTYRMWTPQIEELSKHYHLYVPSLSGHENEDVDYVSADEEADIILKWFEKREVNYIDLICGASLGAHVSASLLKKAPKFFRLAFVESLKGQQYTGITLKLFCYFGAKFMRQCAKVKGYMAGCYKQKYASDDCKSTIQNMTDTSLKNIMIESGCYRIKNDNNLISTNTIIIYGEKEKKECIVNTDILKKQIEQCEVIEIPNYHHGELSIGNPKEHIQWIKRILE